MLWLLAYRMTFQQTTVCGAAGPLAVWDCYPLRFAVLNSM